jgi:hypothetical protein
MTDFRLLLSGIEFKIRSLLEERRKNQESIAELKLENQELKQQIEIINQQLRQYEENTRADALAAALLESQDKSEVKDRIDGLLEEIDQCIDLLNQ